MPQWIDFVIRDVVNGTVDLFTQERFEDIFGKVVAIRTREYEEKIVPHYIWTESYIVYIQKLNIISGEVAITALPRNPDDKYKLANTIDIGNMCIEELDVSVRSYNCLKRAGINTVEDLIEKSEEDMMKVRNLGRRCVEEIKEKLETLGLSLADSEDEW